MVIIEKTLTKNDHNTIRYCGNCKKEYNLDDFTVIYPKPHHAHAQVMKLWHNKQIQFYCSYCYLLETIKKIKKSKKEKNN